MNDLISDTGSLDGVPVVTLDELASARSIRLKEISRLATGLTEPNRNRGASRPAKLTHVRTGRVLKFESLADACEKMNVDRQNLRYYLRRFNNVIGDWRWTIGALVPLRDKA